MENWIDIHEQLPPENVRVLGCTRDGWVFIGKNWTVGDEIHEGENGIAYWQPLPEPPAGVRA